jgi:hypothetical protein
METDAMQAMPPVELRNEFAAVRLEIDHHGNGPRLKITDLETGIEGYFDPFALQVLAWLPAARLEALLVGVFRSPAGDQVGDRKETNR